MNREVILINYKNILKTSIFHPNGITTSAYKYIKLQYAGRYPVFVRIFLKGEV